MFIAKQRRRGGLGQDATGLIGPLASSYAAWAAQPYQPIWSEQSYVPGAVNSDPSINTNPSPTVAGVARDIAMVVTDPMATNPVYNATDTPETAPPDPVGIPAWWLIPAAAAFLWLVTRR